MVGAVFAGAAASHRAETVVVTVLVVDIGALHLVTYIGLLRSRGNCKTVIGELYRPYSGVASETSPEQVYISCLLVAYDIGVYGIGYSLRCIVNKHSVLFCKRVEIFDVLPGERPFRTVRYCHAAGAPCRIVHTSERIIEHIAAVDVFDVRCPDSSLVNPLRTVHSAECIADQFPVYHIL